MKYKSGHFGCNCGCERWIEEDFNPVKDDPDNKLSEIFKKHHKWLLKHSTAFKDENRTDSKDMS